MRRALVIAAALVVAGGAAHAGPRIAVPAGWTRAAVQSEELRAKLAAQEHLGLDRADQPLVVDADVYVAPKPGVVLSVVHVTATTQDQRSAAARAAVDDLHASSQRAALAGSGIVEDGWQEKVDPAAKQIEAQLAWRDTGAKTSSTARLLVVADATYLVALTGECFAADDADARLVADCKAALATLDPGIAPEQRVLVDLAPTGTRPARTSVRPPARMDDGSRAPLPPITVRQEPAPVDRRPVYVGIGLVVLAGLFWWNRHRRARREEQW